MRIRTVSDTATQLTRYGFVNAYLVRDGDGFTLVDTTMNAAEQLIAAAPGPITCIVLTHGHGDHVGSLDALKEKLPDVPVHMPAIDAAIHAGERPKTKGMWPKLNTKPDVLLKPGHRVGTLEVIAAPGHTPGHVAFLDTRDRTLFAGDTFTSYGRVEVSNHFYWRFPLAASATDDKAQDAESARALRALEPTLLLVGHGPPTRDPLAAIDAAIARAD